MYIGGVLNLGSSAINLWNYNAQAYLKKENKEHIEK